jgi:lipopolysaccharide assembly protein A
MVRFLCLLFLIAVGVAIAGFAMQNNHEVTIQFYDRAITAPVSAVVGVAYALGMLTGWSLVGLLRRSFQRATDFRREPAQTR